MKSVVLHVAYVLKERVNMFGYVVVNKPELKIREFEVYQGYYCGLCKSIKKRYGNLKRLTLNYDLTFVALLLSSLDLSDPTITQENCLIHPTQKKKIYYDEYVDYCADMTILFSYYKCKDDWMDDHKKSAWLLEKGLYHSYQKVLKRYPKKCERILSSLDKLNQYEQNNEQNIDTVSNCFGEVMAEVLCFKNEEWHSTLSQIGHALGKFIYLMDAYDDICEDKKKNEYNVLLHHSNIEERIDDILTTVMADCLESYENLPIVENDDLLKNIICSGVWNKYQMIQKERRDHDGSL